VPAAPAGHRPETGVEPNSEAVLGIPGAALPIRGTTGYHRTMQPADVNKMRAAGKLAAQTLQYAGTLVKPGITTGEIDRLVHNFTINNGGRPAPLNYRGFPKSCCISPNDVVCHGIPGPRVLVDGDIVNIDVTTILDGHFGDTNATFFVGTPKPEVVAFVNRAGSAMWVGIHQVKPGAKLCEVGQAIEAYARASGLTVVREFGGHGIGRRFHDVPHVNHYANDDQTVLIPGMTFTIEPMLNQGEPGVVLDMSDMWTVRTADGSWSCQFENTVLVTEDGVEVLTRSDC
jgi:methionyl aminopeptidase